MKFFVGIMLLFFSVKQEILASYSSIDFSSVERIEETYHRGHFKKVTDFLGSINDFISRTANNDKVKKAACKASRQILMGEVFFIDENLTATSSEVNLYNELIAKDAVYNSPPLDTLIEEFKQPYERYRSSIQRGHLAAIFQRQFLAVKSLSEPLTIQTYSANMPLFSLSQWSDEYQRLCVQKLPELQGTGFIEENGNPLLKNLKQPFQNFLVSLKKEYEVKPFAYPFGNLFSNPFGSYNGGIFPISSSPKASFKYGKPLREDQMTRQQKIQYLPLGKVNIQNSSSFQRYYATHNGQVTANNSQQSFNFSGSIEIGGEQYSVEEALNALGIPKDTSSLQISSAITLKKCRPSRYNETTREWTPIYFE